MAFDPGEEAPINGLLGHSITYRIATGPREGQKVFTLQAPSADTEHAAANVAASSGFWLHACAAAKAAERDKLEHLARYIARPPVASERLARTEGGQVRYTLTNRQDCRFARPKAARRAGHRDVPGETCGGCRGRLRVIAGIETPAVIERILEHLGGAAEMLDPAHPSRGPPQHDLPI